MREIKFRVWFKNYKRFMDMKDEYERSLYLMDIGKGKLVFENNIEDDGGLEYYNKNGHVLSQYTGVKDKNGTDIYEGDIVNYEDNEHYGIVVFKKGAFGVDYYNFDTSDCPLFYTFYELMHNKKQLLVAGNIYEDSDALTISKGEENGK